MQGLSALALLDVPGDGSSTDVTEDPSVTTGEQSTVSPENTTRVGSDIARSFHTFQDTFLQMHVYHPNEEAEWNAAREQGRESAKVPIPGFPVAKQIQTTPSSDISSLLVDKTAAEKANIKATEIVKFNFVGTYTKNDISVEIQSVEKIDGGIQIFARAWKNGKQLGFGVNGTTDLERFRIFNPPILVDDPNGTIVRTWIEESATSSAVKNRTLREDPVQAITETLLHTISLVGKEGTHIRVGSVGNTTDTFFSVAGANDPTDGTMIRHTIDDTFSNVRNSNGNGFNVTDATGQGNLYASAVSNQFAQLTRTLHIFDTSAISAGDSISSATFSFAADLKTNELGSPAWHAFYGQSAANNTFANSDFEGNAGKASIGSIAYASINIDGSTYNDIAISSFTGINKGASARTHIGRTFSWDINNSFSGEGASWGSGLGVTLGTIMADTAGTSKDPTLVVVHSAVQQGPSAPTALFVDGLTNPSNIATSSPDFSAVHENASTTAIATSYHIQVDTAGTFTSPYWDSGERTLSSSTPMGMRTPNIYATTTFALDGTKYYWRIKFWDQTEGEGDYSTATSTFKMRP